MRSMSQEPDHKVSARFMMFIEEQEMTMAEMVTGVSFDPEAEVL